MDLNSALLKSPDGVVSLQFGKSAQTANDDGNLRVRVTAGGGERVGRVA